MSLERFTEINKAITIISKDDIVDDKVGRECKSIKYLEHIFNLYYEPGEFLAIDEGMMPFKGGIKNRVYNPMKLDKWGMKFYICSESTKGYVLNLRICGLKTSIEKTFADLTTLYEDKNRKLYMDNFYNSFGLSKLLLDRKIYTCGTLRDRRKGAENLKRL